MAAAHKADAIITDSEAAKRDVLSSASVWMNANVHVVHTWPPTRAFRRIYRMRM